MIPMPVSLTIQITAQQGLTDDMMPDMHPNRGRKLAFLGQGLVQLVQRYAEVFSAPAAADSEDAVQLVFVQAQDSRDPHIAVDFINHYLNDSCLAELFMEREIALSHLRVALESVPSYAVGFIHHPYQAGFIRVGEVEHSW